MRVREDNLNKGFDVHDIGEPYVSIQVFRRDAGWSMPPHSHRFYQLIFVTAGTLHVECANRQWTVGAGQVHVLPPHIEHALHTQGYEQLGVDIRPDNTERNLAPLLLDYIPESVVVDCPDTLADIRDLIDRRFLGNRISTARMVALLDTIVIKCLEAHTAAGAERFDRKLSDYINRHLSEKLSLKEMARDFHMSIPHLERMARKHFDNSVIELRNLRRLTYAKALLVSTELPISEIAGQVGFQDPAHFSTFFRKRMNMPPSAYRLYGIELGV